MMQVAELVARKNGMKGVMLTTFKNNPPATAFYNKLKYNISPISPSWVNPLGAEEYTYEIMAKIFCEEASQVAAVAPCASNVNARFVTDSTEGSRGLPTRMG